MTLLITWVWQGLLFTAVTALAVRLLPAGAARTRHAIWWLALIVVLCQPWLPITGSMSSVLSSAPMVAAGGGSTGLTIPAPPRWLLLLGVAGWLTGVAVGFGRLLVSVRRLQHLTGNASRLEPEHEARLTRWMDLRSSRRPATLRVSPQVSGACAIGLPRPTILVSPVLVEGLSDEALDLIVLHEQGHLTRYDDWSRLVQLLVVTVAGLHPAVRWICRSIDREREIACDQWVVTQSGSALVYAHGLTDAAALVAGRRPTPAPALAMAATGPMLGRRVQVLMEIAGHGGRPSVLRATVCLGAMLATLFAVSHMPEVVRFDAPARAVSAIPGAPLSAVTIANVSSGAWEQQDVPVSRRALATLASGGESRARSEQRQAAVGTATRAGQQVAVAVDRDRDPLSAAPELTPPVALTSAPLAWTAAMPPAAGAVGQDGQDVSEAAGMGRLAAVGEAGGRVGGATGATAARAGRSVGRFFRDRGAAVARSFQ